MVSKIGTWIHALRIHQWAKNLLVFVPLLGAHAWDDPVKVTATFMAFATFCLGASSAYLANDLLDLAGDRAHPRKGRRPIARGTISAAHALGVSVLLLVAAGAAALFLPWPFAGVFAVYYVLTTLYSVWLKRIALVDVFVLAALYGVRILAGSEAARAPVSDWLLVFGIFIFLSLALLKRFTEVRGLSGSESLLERRRGYRATDLPLISALGISTAVVSVLVLALYISSDTVTSMYLHPRRLWLACPVLLYWLSRVWLLAHRGEMHDDPIVFALKDFQSYAAGVLLLALALTASPA